MTVQILWYQIVCSCQPVERVGLFQVQGRCSDLNQFGKSCLVHIWLAMGLRSPYPARILLSVRPPGGVRAEVGGGCEIFVRIHGLRGLYNLV